MPAVKIKDVAKFLPLSPQLREEKESCVSGKVK